MKPKFTQEMIDKKLKEIQNSIPTELLEFDEKLKTPAMSFLAKKLLESSDTKPEIRAEVERLQRLGIFDQKDRDFGPEKQKKIMEYLEREILMAIKRGELPHPDQSPFMKRVKILKRNARA